MSQSFVVLFSLFLGLAMSMAPAARAFTIQVDTDGREVRAWATNEIAFDYNYTDCISQGVTEEQLNAAIDTALSVWNSTLTSSIRLSRGSAVTKTHDDIETQTSQKVTSNPLILCDSNLAADIADGGTPPQTNNIPAVTRVLLADSARHIALSAVYINAEAGKAANVANVIGRSNLLEVVLAHEIGHAIGLGHSADVNALMYYDASSKERLALAQDDVTGITYLYPRQELLGGDSIFGCGSLAGSVERPGAPGSQGWRSFVQFLALLATCWLVVFAFKWLHVRRVNGLIRPGLPLDSAPTFRI